MAFTDTIQLHHVASHTQGDCCCPFRPSDQHCSRNDPKATAAPLLPPPAIPTSLFATTQLYPFTVCSPLFFHLFTFFVLLFQIKTNTIKNTKMSTTPPTQTILATSILPQPKKKITNWSRNPRNCHTMFKLLGDCITKSETTKPCYMYHNLLVQCHQK